MRLGLSSLAYYGAMELSFQLPELEGLVAAIWPSAGVALAVLLLSPRRLWPWLLGCLFVVGVLANLSTERPFFACVGFMVANIGETAVSAWLITRYCEGPIRFGRVREAVMLGVAAFPINAAMSLIGAGTATLAQGSGFWIFYFNWWISGCLGLLVVTPLIMAWVPPWRREGGPHWGRRLERVVLFVLTCAVTWFIFGRDASVSFFDIHPYLLLVFFLWAAIRTSPRCVVILLAVVSLIAVFYTVSNAELLQVDGTHAPMRLLEVQVFLCFLALSKLILAAAIVQYKESQIGLRETIDALRESEGRYRTLFDRANTGIFLMTGDGKMVAINNELAWMHGMSVEEMMERGWADLDAPESARLRPERMRRLLAGESLTFEVEHYHKDGHVFPLEVTGGMIRIGEEVLIQCFHRDISEHRRMEEQARLNLVHAERSRAAVLSAYEDVKQAQQLMAVALREKEALLKEIHHRVKNNLQIISSLLHLQAEQLESSSAKAALMDIQNRVRSMALIHEHLYGSTNLADVDMADYLKQLCGQLYRVMASDPDRVHLRLDLEPVHLEIDQAIPCGLLVNELVSNAFKHAFVGVVGGEVGMELGSIRQGKGVRLRVLDNGVGLPVDFDMKHLSSLGMQLVRDLTRQLGGQLEIGAGPGAEFVVEFPRSGS